MKKWAEQKNTSQKKSKILPIEKSQKNTMNEIKKELILLPENDIEARRSDIPNSPGIYKIFLNCIIFLRIKIYFRWLFCGCW